SLVPPVFGQSDAPCESALSRVHARTQGGRSTPRGTKLSTCVRAQGPVDRPRARQGSRPFYAYLCEKRPPPQRDPRSPRRCDVSRRSPAIAPMWRGGLRQASTEEQFQTGREIDSCQGSGEVA